MILCSLPCLECRGDIENVVRRAPANSYFNNQSMILNNLLVHSSGHSSLAKLQQHKGNMNLLHFNNNNNKHNNYDRLDAAFNMMMRKKSRRMNYHRRDRKYRIDRGKLSKNSYYNKLLLLHNNNNNNYSTINNVSSSSAAVATTTRILNNNNDKIKNLNIKNNHNDDSIDEKIEIYNNLPTLVNSDNIRYRRESQHSRQPILRFLPVNRNPNRQKRKKYCSARDPKTLAFEAPTVFEGKIKSMTSDRQANFSATLEIVKVYKQQNGFALPRQVRLQFAYRNSSECDIYREEFRHRGFVRDELEQGKIYFLFVKQISLGNFTILGQPIRKLNRTLNEVMKGVNEKYGK